MSIITAFEHQTLTSDDFSSDCGSNHCNPSINSNISDSRTSDFHWLLAKVEAGLLPCFTLGVQSGQVVIKVRHYLSVIYLPSGRTLEILPKVSRTHSTTHKKSTHRKTMQTAITETHQWVNLMLCDVYHLKRNLPVLGNSQTINSSNSTESKQPDKLSMKTWLQPIIEQWFELMVQLKLPKFYNQNQQNHPQAQGKLLIKEQLKHNTHRPHYRYTSQQQLGLHKLWWQFFYTTSNQVKKLGIRIPSMVAQQLQTLLHDNQQINPRLTDLPPKQWQHSYQQLKQQLGISKTQQDQHSHQHLTQALELAWFILQLHNQSKNAPNNYSNYIPNSNPMRGDNLVPSVMINMHQAFEQWVSIRFAKQFSHLGEVTAQSQSVWLKDRNNPNLSGQRYLQPDIVIEEIDKTDKADKKIELIADIKYKSIHKLTDIKPSDLYQLFTYQQHWQSKQVWLIFPQTNRLKKPICLTGTDKNGIANLEIKIIPFDMIKGELIT